MKQVKGSMAKFTIKAIKANKNGAYENLLSDKAKEMLKQRILDAAWYPFDVYKECLNALCKVEARDNTKIIHEWGKHFGEILMTSIYKLSIVKGDLKRSIDKYQRFHTLTYNFGKILIEFPTDNQLIVTYRDIDRDFKNWYYLAFGWLERFIEIVIDKKLTLEILKKSWEGDNETQFKLSWPS
ncbi:MAG: hypothetical protein ACFFBP_03360 [Promethearchaeota archaeon]